MKTFWKWILGILLVLLVIGLFVGMAFLLHGGVNRGVVIRGDQDFGPFGRGPMMGQGQIFGNGIPGRMMGGFGFASPFLMICRFFLGLIPLAILVLIVYGAYRLGTHQTHSQVSNPAASSSLAASEAAASPSASVKTCRKCGSELQEGWHNCPICGTKQ